jgi:hypothetical protein
MKRPSGTGMRLPTFAPSARSYYSAARAASRTTMCGVTSATLISFGRELDPEHANQNDHQQPELHE